MPTALFIKTDQGHLIAGDEYAKRQLDKMPVTGYVLARLQRTRNPRFHRKFFALMNLIFENQTIYPTMDRMLCAIKIHVGLCETHELRDGTKVAVPLSIAFDKMDQGNFDEFFESVVTVIREKILPGISRQDLEREVLDLIS